MKVSAERTVSCSFIPSSCVCFKKLCVRRNIAKKIENVKASLDEILKEKDDFKFFIFMPETDHMSISWKDQSTSSIELEKISGADINRNKNDLVRKLMLNGGGTQILSIVGMGGLGKTTLAQLVYNDTQVQSCFELRIWICVSHPFDVAGIAREIVNSVEKETIPPNTNQLEMVMRKLRASVSGKKFLLVLDDVWTEDNNKWEPLNVNLKYGAPGSKILVTTRNEMVAKMMGTLDDDIYLPKVLSVDECWSLMSRISLSGRSEEKCIELEVVGKKIASRCKGLPLAANVLGKLLKLKDSFEAWEEVWRSEIWQLENAEVDLFPHLVLSYNDLSSPLKRCFSYCAVYPKDHPIDADRLIEEWMALGYLGPVSGNNGIESKGREYLNNLAIRSLFQDIEESDEQIQWCKMHDIVHDFALFLRKNDAREEAGKIKNRSCQVCDPFLVSQVHEYRSLYWADECFDHCDCITSFRVLRFERGSVGPLPRGMEKLIHLRLLELSENNLNEEDLKIICTLYFLQTLILSSCSLITIPEEIANLVHLRNLDLSLNKFLDLPESMCSLVKLQMLNLRQCKKLNKLPEGIHMLENLQHLLIGGTFKNRGLVEGVAQLRVLRTLGRIDGHWGVNKFRVGSDWNKFELLKNLNLLTGSLKLEIFAITKHDVEELARTAAEAELRNKKHIHSLLIIFNCEYDLESYRLWIDVLEALQPHQMVNSLFINGYEGDALPRWMSSPLNFVKQVHLKYCSVSSLTHMGKLPLLEDLTLQTLNQIELLGKDFLGIESSPTNHVVVFPELKKLTFWDWNYWYEWEDIAVEDEESTVVSIMPRLTELCITSCRSLKKLPHRLLRKASSSLLELDIMGSTELVKTYGEDKEGSPWRSISQHNPQLLLRK